MCLTSIPKNADTDPNRAAQAAADAATQARRTAQGYTASIFGGMPNNGNQPSLARTMLLGSG